MNPQTPPLTPDGLRKKRVDQFLEDMKSTINQRGYAFDGNREKNRDTLLELDLPRKERDKALLSLSSEDYCQGPEKEERGKGSVWVFGKKIKGREIYIKLIVVRRNIGLFVICRSFHFSEHALFYPLRGV